MKHFIDKEMAAPNVMRVPVAPDIVAEFAEPAVSELPRADYVTSRPSWKSDVRWIAARSQPAFDRFETAFHRLGIAGHVAPYLDLEKEVRLYAGFLVIRTECSEPDFHLDWFGTNNEGFTLITPVSANAAGFGLLYRRIDGKPAEYEYRLGEAIVFGDHFVHSTRPGRSEEPVVLLSFTFGTDRMEHWDKLIRTAGHHAGLIRRPDGVMVSRPAVRRG